MSNSFLPLANPLSTKFTDYQLYDYIQADTRPTFLLNRSGLECSAQNVHTAPAFFNLSLSNNRVLLDEIARVINGVLGQGDNGYDDAIDFQLWILGNDQSSTWFCDTLWSSTNLDSSWRVISGVQLSQMRSPSRIATIHHHHEHSDASEESSKVRVVSGHPTRSTHEDGATSHKRLENDDLHHSGTLLCKIAETTPHQRAMQSFAWAETELGPIETWPQPLFHAVKLALASPMAVLIYWGPSRNVLWNDAATSALRSFEPVTPGISAYEVFRAFWEDTYELSCREVERTGQPLTLSKSPGPIIERDGGLRETCWTYNQIPLLDDNGNICGIYAPIHDCTTEVLTEGRIDTLLNINEALGTVSDLSSLWQTILGELRDNPADMPLAAIYSIGSEAMLDRSSGLDLRNTWQAASSNTPQDDINHSRKWYLEGQIGFPNNHVCVPSEMSFLATDGLSPVFQQAMKKAKMEDVLLCTENGTLPPDFLDGCEDRGLGFQCTQLVACPLQQPRGGVIAWLVLGINPRRTFDSEYKRFTRLLSRHIESKLVLILSLEREKRLALQNAQEAARQQEQLSLQIQQQRLELEQSETRFFNFAKQTMVGVYILGNKGEIKFCNDAWYRMFDIEPGTMAEKTWLPRAHPDDFEKIEAQWNLFQQGYSQDRFEWRILRPEATSFDSEDDITYLESCGFPEMAPDGTMKTVTGLTTDVSILKAYQREQAEKLRNALEEKRTQEYFMDMVSHEMRNPLNAILQCAEETSHLIEKLKDNLKTEIDPETSTIFHDMNDMINTMLYCGLHQKQLIDDVLTLSKLDSKLLIIYPAKIYPAALLDQAIKVFTSEIRASRIEVSTSVNDSIDTDDNGAAAIMVDPSRILQILINLISNAIKFMKGREKRKLHTTVHISRERQSIGALQYVSSGHERTDLTTEAEWGTGEIIYLYFSVRDTGPGLTQTEMSSLFSRFKQASPRTHVTYGGSGLGLFISRELTELHGGAIGMTSEVGVGSTFGFYVKGRRYVAASETSAANFSPPPEGDHQRKVSFTDRRIPVTPPSLAVSPPRQLNRSASLHVLVVEDNDINRRVIKRQLEKMGYQVTTAIHGAEALSILKTSTWWQGGQMQDETRLQESYNGRLRLSVILCDLEMPVMDGVTCVRQIRQWQREGLLLGHIPVIAVTGNARAETTFLAAESDFDSVVSKPYSFKSLVEQMLAQVDRAV